VTAYGWYSSRAAIAVVACLHDQNKSGRLFSRQIGLFENISDCSDPPKSHFCFDHVNKLLIMISGILCMLVAIAEQIIKKK